MESVEITAKTWQEALEDGLRQLSASIDDVNVKVLDVGGFFRDAKIIVTLTPEAERQRARQRIKESERAKETERRESFPQRQENPQRQEKRNEPTGQDKKTDKQPPKEHGQNAERKPVTAQPAAPKQDKRQSEAKEDEVPVATVDAVLKFLSRTLEKMGMTAQFKSVVRDSDLEIEILSEDQNIVGYHGETIEALEYMATSVANKGGGKFVHVSLDCNNYRDKKNESVIKYAEKMALKCIKSGRKVSLEPMNSAMRKIVHAALSANEQVTTKSEGKEPNRRIVIYCKRPPEQRENRPQGGGQKREQQQRREKEKIPASEKEQSEKELRTIPKEIKPQEADVPVKEIQTMPQEVKTQEPDSPVVENAAVNESTPE